MTRKQHSTVPMLWMPSFKNTLPTLPTEPKQHEERVLGKNSTGLERLLRSDRRGQINLTVEERRIALYKIDGYAAQGGLVMPARACRMIGEGRFGERLDVLHYFAQNPKASPFTRRDAFVGLRKLAARDKKSIDVMLSGLQDPYFETVNESLLCLDYIVEQYREEITDHIEGIHQAVLPFATHEAFDIRMRTLAALSELVPSKDAILPLLQENYFHPKWKVRQGIMKNFATLMKRGLMTKQEVEDELPNILQTSNGFDMNFRLKREIRNTLQKQDKEILVERVQSLLSTQEQKRKYFLTRIESIRSFAKERQLSFEVYDALEMLLQNEELNQREESLN